MQSRVFLLKCVFLEYSLSETDVVVVCITITKTEQSLYHILAKSCKFSAKYMLIHYDGDGRTQHRDEVTRKHTACINTTYSCES